MVTVKALPGRYAKFLTAAAGIGIVFAQNQVGASNQWVQLAVAVAAALGVLAVPNTPAPPPPLILSGTKITAAMPDPPMDYLAPPASAMQPPPTGTVTPPPVT